jgi:hypothetical protein
MYLFDVLLFFLWIRFWSDPELFGQVRSGIIVPDPDRDLTFDKEICIILHIFLQNAQFVFDYGTYILRYFVKKS